MISLVAGACGVPASFELPRGTLSSELSLLLNGAGHERCTKKLLVVSVPDSAPPCLRSAVSAKNLSQLPAPCGTASDGSAMQIAPCSADDPVCVDYAKKYARSWFTPHVYRLPEYATQLPLQRTWMLARLTAVDSVTGAAAEPCVTHNVNTPDIGAVLLLPPATMLLSGANSTEDIICAGHDREVVQAVVAETLSRFEKAARGLPEHRRFVVSMDQLTPEQVRVCSRATHTLILGLPTVAVLQQSHIPHVMGDQQADGGYLAFQQTISKGLPAYAPQHSNPPRQTVGNLSKPPTPPEPRRSRGVH